jgi:hypothetical protein
MTLQHAGSVTRPLTGEIRMALHTRSLQTPTLIVLLSGFGLALPSYARAAMDPVAPAYTVTPNPALVNTPFTLYVNGTGATCNTLYSHQTVTVVGKQISLAYVAQEVYMIDDAAVAGGTASGNTGKSSDATVVGTCPVYAVPLDASGSAGTSPIVAPIRANAPAFSLPALAAGEYAVSVSKLAACMVSTPACMMAVLPVSAGTLSVEPTAAKPNSYTITPISTAPEQAFELSLQSYEFDCGTSFDSLGVNVAGNNITLSFLDHANPNAICPAIYRPYGPTFKLPALKSGTYAVSSYRLPACYPCKMAGETAQAGTLTVRGDAKRTGWFLKEKLVGPENLFTLQLLNNEIGNCQTSFSHQSASVTGNDIYAKFVLESHPERVCIQDMHPYGPSFEMKALKLGLYPVYAEQQALCEVEAPYCAVLRSGPLTPSDTLLVAETFVTRLSDLRAQAPKVEMRGSHAAFVLPEGIGGTWKAELVTVSGRQLRALTVTGEGGSRTELDLGADLKAGLYLLRLHGPDGDTQVLPIVKQGAHD